MFNGAVQPSAVIYSLNLHGEASLDGNLFHLQPACLFSNLYKSVSLRTLNIIAAQSLITLQNKTQTNEKIKLWVLG
jgi:hypothetical protein